MCYSLVHNTNSPTQTKLSQLGVSANDMQQKLKGLLDTPGGPLAFRNGCERAAVWECCTPGLVKAGRRQRPEVTLYEMKLNQTGMFLMERSVCHI